MTPSLSLDIKILDFEVHVKMRGSPPNGGRRLVPKLVAAIVRGKGTGT
jgi:hypothetical protein